MFIQLNAMTLYLPHALPVAERLRQEGATVVTYDPKKWNELPEEPGKERLRILFLNLMPQKEVTELDIARMMLQAGLDVQLIPMKLSGQTYKTTPMAHMQAFYTDFEDLATGNFDGMILTGAPIEHIGFEEVRYWRQLCEVMEWAKSHVRSSLFICWGAQAGLYYHFGIPKYMLPAKMFGIYNQEVYNVSLPLLQDMVPAFPMPLSRHTEVRATDFPKTGGLQIVAGSEAAGVAMAIAHDGREVFTVGHLEYEPNTLHNEYQRDLGKGLPIDMPKNYYVDDQPEKGVRFQWTVAARCFYRNWLNHYCRAKVEA